MTQKDLYTYYFNDGECIVFRLLSDEDSIEELTLLLHKAYKFLADMGLKFVATFQDNNTTQKRTREAYKCFVGIYKNKIVSTISLYSPKHSEISSWYNKDFVAKFGQFAVEPELQKYGIGTRMMDIVEQEARRIENVREIALDTAETAYHLIDFYKKRGYRYIETIKWNATNYLSVVLSKALDG